MATTAPRPQAASLVDLPAQADPTAAGSSRSYWGDSWIRFKRDRLALVGGILYVALCMMALLAPWISENVTGYDPNRINLSEQYAPPSARHWFGADEYGRDYLTARDLCRADLAQHRLSLCGRSA